MMSIITTLAGLIRFIRIGEPARRVFDEAFYARDSCLYAGLAEATCAGTQHAEVHPPLAKWLIAVGIRAFGYNATGWRVMSAIAGTVTIAILYVLAKRLLESTLAASLVSGLLAVDLLHFVLSRVAMLDVFVTLFSTLAFVFLAFERGRELQLLGKGPLVTIVRAGIGVSCGLALASKWSGGLTLLACIWLLLAWSSKRQEGASSFVRLARAAREQGGSIALTLLIIPLVVYLVIGIATLDLPPGVALSDRGQALLSEQNRMLNFHRHSIGTTIASSPPWSWLLLKRPVPYFAEKGEQIREVWFGGNPLIWWPALLALVYAGIRWIRKQDPRDPDGFILVGFLLLYLPWILLTIPPLTWSRTLVFIFYLLPALPFVYLGLARGIQCLGKRARRPLALGSIAVAIGGYAYFYPILSALPISRDAWLARVGFFSNCERPPPPIFQIPDGDDGDMITLTLRADDPPAGWCWK